MNRIPLSAAATALLGALLGRARITRDRILLMDAESVGAHSLSPASATSSSCVSQVRTRGRSWSACALVSRSFSIPGVIVADITAGALTHALGGSISFTIGALTVAED
jgi:hypothetical protein